MKAVAYENLPLHLLKTFCVFAETGKVEEAAQKLGMTQASISLQLKKLEEETGQNLFKMVGRKKLLSAFARDLFQSIAPPLRELELRLKEVSKTKAPPEQRTLRIGCPRELIKRVTPLIHFPGQIAILNKNSAESLLALRNDEIDVAISSLPATNSDWQEKKLFIEQPVLIANSDILKVRRWENLSAQNLSAPAVSFHKPAKEIRQVVDKLGGKSSQVKIKMYCEDWDSLIDIVKRTRTWSILPSRQGYDLHGLAVVDIPVKILPTKSIYAVYDKDNRDSFGRYLK